MGKLVINPLFNVYKKYRQMIFANPYRFEQPIVVLPFVSTWKTDNISTGSSANNQVKLPLDSSGIYNFNVDWGDGNYSTITSYNQADVTHTYSVIGTYQISITGIIKGWTFNTGMDRLKLLSIESWGVLILVVIPTIHKNNFISCANLNLSAVSDLLNLSEQTTLTGLFAYSGLTIINKINEWDFSTIESIEGLFQNCSTYNQYFNPPTLQNLKNCKGTFYKANSFNQNLGDLNISNVTDLSNFMYNKTAANFSTQNLDAIYNGWSSRPVKPNIVITFGTAKYTAAGSVGRAILTNAPNNWVITDGGI